MSLQKLYQHIETLDNNYQKDLLDLYEVMNILYKQYGNKILQASVIEKIKDISPDLVDLISLTHTTAGLEYLPQIISTLQNKKFPEIKMVESQHIGIKVTSNTGKKYERTLNKDLVKLSQ